MPGPERTLIEFANSDSTQISMRGKGRFVGEGVRVSSRVGVSVCEAVGERVAVALGEMVGVKVSASLVEVAGAGSVGVAVGGGLEGVTVVTTSGVRTNVDRIASKKPIAMMMGTAYLRSMSGNAEEVVTGFSPVYPSASSRLLRLAA